MSETSSIEIIEPAASSSDKNVALDNIKDDDGLRPPKKRKIESDKEPSDKLEHRLGGILCCAVCLDLPQAAVYQCTNGHLMCAPCFMHLLADARLRDESATCPNCRVEISKTSASRNLAVEKTVSELPSECKFCTKVFPRHSLQHHEENICDDSGFTFSQLAIESSNSGGGLLRWPLDGLFRIVSRVCLLVLAALRDSSSSRPPAKRRRAIRITGCRYACIGCSWRGPAHEASAHHTACPHPNKSAADVMDVIAERERKANDSNIVYSQILDLLSCEKLTFTDLQLKPYRTEEFVHKLYYETSRFSAFGQQWVVKAFVNRNQRDPTQSSQREITYQLILKSKCGSPLSVQWSLLRGPWGEARLAACTQTHVYREEAPDAAPRPLPLADPADVNRLLSNKAIHFRLIMFQSSATK